MAGNKKELSNTELALFCEQMAMILGAGISPLEGISVMAQDIDSKEGREILKTIENEYITGVTFHKALEKSEVFPDYALNMIRLGEESGNLEEVMDLLAFHYNREQSIAEGIKSAVTYPFIIIGMMAIVILVLIIKVLPIFQRVFESLGSELTGLSKGLLNIGNVIGNYSIVFIGILLLAFILYLFFMKTDAGHRAFTKICSGFFLTRDLSELIATGRFASGMALTLSAGLNIEDSLEMSEKLSENKRLNSKIERCKELLEEGKSFPEALSQSKTLSGTYCRLIIVGEKTGCTDKVIKKIAVSIDNETESTIANIIGVLEPTLVIILSIIICMILLSVMLPLMGILSGMM